MTHARSIDDDGRRSKGDQFSKTKRTGEDIHADLDGRFHSMIDREKNSYRVDSIIDYFRTGHTNVLNDIHGEFLRPFSVDLILTDGKDTDLSLITHFTREMHFGGEIPFCSHLDRIYLN